MSEHASKSHRKMTMAELAKLAEVDVSTVSRALNDSPLVKEKTKRLILDIAAEQFYAMGTVLPADGYIVANENLGNVPEKQVYTWVYPQPGPMETSQLYFKK